MAYIDIIDIFYMEHVHIKSIHYLTMIFEYLFRVEMLLQYFNIYELINNNIWYLIRAEMSL